MRIGLDFDNTIIDYNEVFFALASTRKWVAPTPALNKEEVKEALLQADGNDRRWQELQALAYGPEILRAKISAGLLGALEFFRDQGHEVMVVSHKSETSNLDGKTPLREWARRWIQEARLPIDLADIHFEPTLAEKVARIAGLKCDLFVDDLPSVFAHESFPHATCQAFLYRPLESATEAPEAFVVSSWAEVESAVMALSLAGPSGAKRLSCFHTLPTAGNNRLNRAVFTDGRELALKRYFLSEKKADSWNRGEREYAALDFLWQNGIRSVPEPFAFDDKRQIGAYSFLAGRRPASSEISEADIDALSAFSLRLFRLSESEDGVRWKGFASDARRSAGDYPKGLERRVGELSMALKAEPHYKGAPSPAVWRDARIFWEEEFQPLYQIALAQFQARSQREGIDLAAPIEKLLLSPSDFGFHNILKQDADGELKQIDFEYFGWDDPAKFLSDFFHHAGQNISWSFRWRFLNNLRRELSAEWDFWRRWELVVDLVGLEWLAIVLNVIVPETMLRKLFANPGIGADELLRERLERARKMCAEIRKVSGGHFLTIPEPHLGKER